MSNTTEQASPRHEKGSELKCDRRLLESLRVSVEADEDDDRPDSGLAFDINGPQGTIYPYFPAGANLDPYEYAMSAIEALAGIIGANGRDYMEFGLSFHTDKCVPGGFGGCKFRIWNDGLVTWSESLFPEDCHGLMEEVEGALGHSAHLAAAAVGNCENPEVVKGYKKAYEKKNALLEKFREWRKTKNI